jgi:hypothetical protein
VLAIIFRMTIFPVHGHNSGRVTLFVACNGATSVSDLGCRRDVVGCPRGTGDGRVDAAFAVMAEYLARRDGWAVPAWAALPEREAWPWWFVTDLRGLHPRALVESQSSFRRRGVFTTSGALDRA